MKKLFILFLICFLSGVVWADDPESIRIFPENQPMTFRGLDDTSSPMFIEDGRGRIVKNVKFSATGGLQKRKGYSLIDETLDQLDTDFPAITGLYDAQYSDGDNYPIATIGDEIYYNDGDSWEDVSGTYTITAGKNNQFVFVTANDYVIATNDVDVPLKISSSLAASVLDTSDLSDTVTKVKCLAWVRNHLILANTVEGGTERPTRIRWSNIGYIETFSDDDYIDIASLSGEEIVAVKELYGELYIFLDKSIWKISYVGGDEIYVLSKVAEGVGCISKNAVQNITLSNNQKGLIFLDREKVIYFFNGIAPLSISDAIDGILDDFNDARLKYAVSAVDDSSFYLGASSSGYTENDTFLEFDYSMGEWIQHTNIYANAMGRIETTDSIIKTYFGNYDAMVYWLDDEDLSSDIDGIIGTVDRVFTTTETWQTATGLQMIVDASLGATTSGLIGGIVQITGGTATGEEQIIADNTTTGIMVTTAFTTTPDSTSSYSIGAIETEYTTKWYDLGQPARRKGLRYLYLWGDAQQDVSHDIIYYKDFGGEIETQSIAMSSGAQALWGTAVWGVDTWGSSDTIFKVIPLTGEGRYFSISFQEKDIDEDMYIYGWNVIYDTMDVE